MRTGSFRELIVWQKSITLVREIYKVVKQLPRHELYILGSQLLRAAISIPSNIAEGYTRSYKAEFIQFLSIALASSAELETQLIIAKYEYSNLDYQRSEALLSEVQKMLFVMIRNLKRK